MRLRGSREGQAVTLSGLGRSSLLAGCCVQRPAPSLPPASNRPTRSLQLPCIALGEYLLTRIGRPRKVQPDTKAVPSLLTKSTTICWLLCLGLAYPHLTSALPTLISRETVCRDSAAVHNP